MNRRSMLIAAVLLVAISGCGASHGGTAGAPGRPDHLDSTDPRVIAQQQEGVRERTSQSPTVQQAEANGRRDLAGASANAQAVQNQIEGTTDEDATRAPDSRATTPAATAPARPPIVPRFIAFPMQRKREMATYAQRHYGFAGNRLVRPHVIVEHNTETTTAASAIATFSADVPDAELHELPGTCAHFVVDRDGTVYQLVSLSLMCRHTVGLNWTAIGIEHVGTSDAQVLGDRRQMHASLALTRWLRCRYGIATKNVIGHAESVRSPYHRERVARLRSQTHADFPTEAMTIYRQRLDQLGSC